MANAYKCDICGKYYEGYTDQKGTSGIVFVTDRERFEKSYHASYVSQIFDICPECIEKTTDFIDNLRSHEKPFLYVGGDDIYDEHQGTGSEICNNSEAGKIDCSKTESDRN